MYDVLTSHIAWLCNSDLKYMFLVGGFAESPILQREIRLAFGAKLKVLIPQDVALTVLKGLLTVHLVMY